jgi:hypothetical protein
MGVDKKKIKPTTVYVPRKIFKEIERFHTSEGRPDMSDSSMIVNLLQRWYDERILPKDRQPSPKEKIGEGLIRIGTIKTLQVEDILRRQTNGDKRQFGEIAVAMQFIDQKTLDDYLSGNHPGRRK